MITRTPYDRDNLKIGKKDRRAEVNNTFASSTRRTAEIGRASCRERV